MAFGDKLREFRISSGFSQQKLADEAKVSLRTIQNYESNQRHPKNIDIVRRLADILVTDVDTLLDEQDFKMMDAGEKGGHHAQRDIQVLASQVSGLFAGGELSEQDKDAAMRAITEAYWAAKAENKKYTPKKHRK